MAKNPPKNPVPLHAHLYPPPKPLSPPANLVEHNRNYKHHPSSAWSDLYGRRRTPETPTQEPPLGRIADYLVRVYRLVENCVTKSDTPPLGSSAFLSPISLKQKATQCEEEKSEDPETLAQEYLEKVRIGTSKGNFHYAISHLDKAYQLGQGDALTLNLKTAYIGVLHSLEGAIERAIDSGSYQAVTVYLSIADKLNGQAKSQAKISCGEDYSPINTTQHLNSLREKVNKEILTTVLTASHSHSFKASEKYDVIFSLIKSFFQDQTVRAYLQGNQHLQPLAMETKSRLEVAKRKKLISCNPDTPPPEQEDFLKELYSLLTKPKPEEKSKTEVKEPEPQIPESPIIQVPPQISSIN